MHLIEQSGLFTLFALRRGRDAETQTGEGPGGSFCGNDLRGSGLSGHQGTTAPGRLFYILLLYIPPTPNRVFPPPSLQSDHLYTAIPCLLLLLLPISAITPGYITTPEDLALGAVA